MQSTAAPRGEGSEDASRRCDVLVIGSGSAAQDEH